MSVTPDCRHIWRTICWRVSLLSLRMYFFARAELLSFQEATAQVLMASWSFGFFSRAASHERSALP